MVGHHGIGGDIEGKYRGQLFDALDDPAPAVFEVVVLSRTAQERPPHTAGYAVVIKNVFKGNQFLPWPGHGSSVNGWQVCLQWQRLMALSSRWLSLRYS